MWNLWLWRANCTRPGFSFDKTIYSLWIHFCFISSYLSHLSCKPVVLVLFTVVDKPDGWIPHVTWASMAITCIYGLPYGMYINQQTLDVEFEISFFTFQLTWVEMYSMFTVCFKISQLETLPWASIGTPSSLFFIVLILCISLCLTNVQVSVSWKQDLYLIHHYN